MSGPCPKCNGYRMVRLRPCANCQQAGIVTKPPYGCPKCSGTGTVLICDGWKPTKLLQPLLRSELCPVCQGDGLIDEARQHKIIAGQQLKERRRALAIKRVDEARTMNITVEELDRLEAGED